MGEFFLFLVGAAATCAALAAPVVLVLTWRRTRRLQRELEDLRGEVRHLRSRVRADQEARAGSAAPSTAASTAASTAQPPAAPQPSPVPAPAPAPAASAPAPAQPEQPTPVRVAPPRARAPRVPIDWERWLGVRGAAVVGGIFLALAAIFFFKHAFTQGWISPEARVIAGLVAGAAAILGAARLRQRGFGWAPSALEGAGVVALYASVWAADERYALISRVVSFPAMAAITALACALALWSGSLFTALLALAGGFLTPLLLAEGTARTLPLFAYLLLLDLGLLFVARRRAWPSLALMALGATFAYEAMSIFRGGERAALGLPIGAMFALLFALAGVRVAQRGRWLASQALGVLLPLVFALHYAGGLPFGAHVWPTALLLALLVVAAALVARQHEAPWLANCAALASIAVLMLWVQALPRRHADEVAWELTLVGLGLALVSHLLAEWEHARDGAQRMWQWSAAAASGAWAVLLLLALASQRLEPFPASLTALLATGALLLRQAALLGSAPAVWGAGLTLGVGLGLVHRGYRVFPEPESTLPDPRVFWIVPVLLGAALLFLVPRRAPALARSARQASALLFLTWAQVGVYGYDQLYEESYPWLLAGLAAPIGAMMLVAAARLASSPWVAGCVWATLVVCARPVVLLGVSSLDHEGLLRSAFPFALAGPAAVVMLAAFLPELRGLRWAWGFLFALAPLSLTLLKWVYVAAYGTAFDAGAPLLVGLPPALAAWILRARGAPRHALGWMAAAAALMWTSALADQLDHAEFAVGCALFAAALAWIAHRLQLAGAAWAAAASALLAALALLWLAQEPQPFERSEPRLLNWISYAHLVPAAALGVVVWLLPPTGERGWLARRKGVLGACVLVLLFLWLNWLIENAFADTPRLRLFAARGHARDLTTSLAWGAYAGVLLVLGTARRVTPLRWASLAVFVLAIAKVFLRDLAHLDGLWRVASLAGLALSLIAVSLFYQRFVFRRLPNAA